MSYARKPSVSEELILWTGLHKFTWGGQGEGVGRGKFVLMNIDGGAHSLQEILHEHAHGRELLRIFLAVNGFA